jgi:Domain of unknown function (DUF4345)
MSESHEHESSPVRAVLLALAAGFVAFGVAFLLAPAKLASLADLAASGKNGLIELRAFYGGIEIGFGVYLGIAALRPSWHVAALWAAILSLAGVVAARIYGISVEGSASAMIYVFLAVEIGAVVAASFGLAKTRKKAEPDIASALAELEDKSPLGKIEKTTPIERTKVIEKTLRLDRKP